MKPEATIFSEAYRYRGILLRKAIVPKDRVEGLERYQDIRADDIIIWTYPKSGTHWIRDIIWMILHEGDEDLCRTSRRDGSLEMNPPKHLVKTHTAGGDSSRPRSLLELSKMKSPRVLLTHLPYSFLPEKVQKGHCKMIFVHRNPKDLVVSAFHMHKNRGAEYSLSDFFNWFVTGDVYFGSWFERMKEWFHRKEKAHIYSTSFEEMKTYPTKVIESLAGFLGKTLPQETVTKIQKYSSFEESSLRYKGSPWIRKGQIGDWKNHLTEEQSQLMDEKVVQEFENMDINVTYQ